MMMTLLERTSVRNLLALQGALAAVAVCGLIAVVVWSWSENDAARTAESRAQDITRSATAVELAVVRLSTAQLAYVTGRTEAAGRALDAAMQAVEASIAQASAVEARTGGAERVSEFRGAFAAYQNRIAALRGIVGQIGLDETAGLQGSLRSAAQDVEQVLDDRLAGSIGATYDVLLETKVKLATMRRHERDFLMGRDPEVAAAVAATGGELEQKLRSAPLFDAVKGPLLEKNGRYLADFEAVRAGFVALEELRSAADAALRSVVEGAAALVAGETATAAAATARAAAFARGSNQVVLWSAVALAVFAPLSARVISRSITGPTTRLAEAMARLSEGHLDTEVPAVGPETEFGAMAQAMVVFKRTMIEAERLRGEEAEAERRAALRRLADRFEEMVGDIVDAVSAASADLESAAERLARTASTTGRLAADVASAASDASVGAESVVSHTRGFSEAMEAIVRKVEASTAVANDAVRQSTETNGRVAALTDAAGRIGDVVEVIAGVAGQTNLLALNATIEAARAGAAGRGFAVVAGEVKALAGQTATATGKIAAEIAAMQSATRGSAAAIEEVGVTIDQMSGIAGEIAAAVAAQGAATGEIGESVRQTARSTADLAAAAREVSKGASETGVASGTVLTLAQGLVGQSRILETEVEKFLATVRAA
ncbi:methyl-accepting chemotaxis protein [Rhodoplanes sp. TEM]|uniref:Methyl-accepting chemotaxis protein n=1 Tax=Rhodoplanes tepidamans TaxID=200616 RepID=A0ABT5J3L4_RHOTP|nr:MULTISPECIES: methyl-accepting chemotaxis protein [Rhodoplanes]MDC7784247.1 methyl-accepting chemotaxis protein [Rhodoplanes tepidamans]MDC7983639.1 methyl-accepting chemotaxis protein [Rhodoplanes sp. TEM]MDQ0353647.1 methyl-accepting chemotaxis protein [Rhodoplanes tepidamans]